MRPNIYVFADLDNVVWSTHQYLHREFDANEIITLAGGWDRVWKVKAYVDFKKCPEAVARHIDGHAFDCRNVPSRGSPGAPKDQVDLRITVDIVKVALQRRDIKEIVLVCGDCDLVPAVSEVIAARKAIRIFAVEGSLSADLYKLVGPERVTYLKGGQPLRPTLLKSNPDTHQRRFNGAQPNFVLAEKLTQALSAQGGGR